MRDTFKDINLIHTISIMKKNVISIVASFLNEWGKILLSSDGCPRFFGYSSGEFSTLKNINQLMPDIIANNHDTII